MAGPMAALLILPLMLHTSTAGTGVELVDLEIPTLCQQGPEYWCQSDETASLCMKEDFCVELWQNAAAETLIGSGAGESAGSLKEPFGENKEWRSKDGTNQLRSGLGLRCRACKYVFNYLKKKVSDDHSEEEIGSALDKVCKSVLFLLRIPCKMVVRKYRDAITQAFEDEEDSATFCAMVKLCRKAEETDVELSYQEDPKLCLQGSEYWCQSEETASLCKKEDYCMELWQNVPAELEASSDGAPEDATEEEEEKRKKKKKNKKRKKDKKNKKDKKGKKGKKNKKRKDKTDVKCSGCTQIVTNLQKTVGENLDDDTVNGAVDSMCDEVDESISEICTTMKENNKDNLVEAVKNGDSPKDICTQVQMCKGQELDYSEEETDVELSYQEDPKLCLQGSEYWCQSEETASLCKKEDYCMELWQNVPAELEASSDGAPEDATEEEEEKRKKKKKNKKRKKDKKNKKDKKGKKGKKNKKRKDKTDVKCSGCTQIVTNLQKTVGENLDDDTVNGAVDSMCDEVDESISEICTTMKENNKDDLVEAVKNGDSPKDICTQIEMCKGQELDYSEGAPVSAPSVGPTCIFCQAFISFVKPLLTDNVHKKDTGPVLADLCMEHFGNSTTCKNFLSTYGPLVKHVLLKPWDEVTTCQEVGACEAGIPMPQFDVKRAASRRKDLEDTRSTQLVMVNA
ncbi:uncharacterized protein LOC144792001 [Lissotriton helveticus]